jgi:hypothetical protein
MNSLLENLRQAHTKVNALVMPYQRKEDSLFYTVGFQFTGESQYQDERDHAAALSGFMTESCPEGAALGLKNALVNANVVAFCFTFPDHRTLDLDCSSKALAEQLVTAYIAAVYARPGGD